MNEGKKKKLSEENLGKISGGQFDVVDDYQTVIIKNVHHSKHNAVAEITSKCNENGLDGSKNKELETKLWPLLHRVSSHESTIQVRFTVGPTGSIRSVTAY